MAYIKSSLQAVSYSKFRPSPPKELVNKIIAFLSEETECPLVHAVDVGCGSGQSTEILTPHFQRVVGVDSSKEQLQHVRDASKHANVSYRLGSAEELLETSGSVDLVTVGMAVHWFDLAKFSAEVSRVLRPGGVLAIYGYSLPYPSVNNTPLTDVVEWMVGNTLYQYTPEQSKLIYFDSYRGAQLSKLPFSSQTALRFEFPCIKKNARASDFVGYASTMSAFQNYKTKHGEGEAQKFLDELENRIVKKLDNNSSSEAALDIIFPYVLLLFKKDL